MWLSALILAASPAPACAAPERSQLDFWVGRWDVYATGTEKLVAHSLIEKLYGGCAIRENWMPLKKPGGGSLSAWDPRAGKWRQTWVDSSGATVTFEGGASGTDMVLQGLWPDLIAPGKDALVRMTYSRLEGGAVRQGGVQSVDGGKSWQPSFDFTYRRGRGEVPTAPRR